MQFGAVQETKYSIFFFNVVSDYSFNFTVCRKLLRDHYFRVGGGGVVHTEQPAYVRPILHSHSR